MLINEHEFLLIDNPIVVQHVTQYSSGMSKPMKDLCSVLIGDPSLGLRTHSCFKVHVSPPHSSSKILPPSTWRHSGYSQVVLAGPPYRIRAFGVDGRFSRWF